MVDPSNKSYCIGLSENNQEMPLIELIIVGTWLTPQNESYCIGFSENNQEMPLIELIIVGTWLTPQIKAIA